MKYQDEIGLITVIFTIDFHVVNFKFNTLNVFNIPSQLSSLDLTKSVRG